MQFLYNQEEQAYNQLTENLSCMLTGYLKHINVKIIYDNFEYSIKQCFDPYYFLPLFLFEQKEYIEQYLCKINEYEALKRHVEISFIHKTDTVLGYFANLENNLTEKESYDFIAFLTKSILKNTQLSLQNNFIYLDDFISTLNAEILKQWEIEKNREKILNRIAKHCFD